MFEFIDHATKEYKYVYLNALNSYSTKVTGHVMKTYLLHSGAGQESLKKRRPELSKFPPAGCL